MQSNDAERVVATIGEAREVARDYARQINVSEERAECLAEVWFNAGKDFDASRKIDLLNYLQRKCGET